MAGPEMLPIFERENRFPSMEDCLAFFTFQKGNGTLHGSKGIGRDIYEMAGMIDRTRNEVVDRLIMSGKTLIQGDVRRIHTFKMQVIGSTVIIPTGWNVLEQKIDGNPEGFVKLDMYFKGLINELIGSTSTPQPGLGGEDMRSPAAWNLLASREEEQRDVRISRFLAQFTELVQTMQRRICDKETSEDDAKAAQDRLMKVMTREELKELASQPVAGTVQDLTPLQRQLVVSISQEKRGNPLYNQRQLELEDLQARMDYEFAERVLLPENDPTEEAEQQRQQKVELMLLGHGEAVPVSPRDNHMIHLQALMPAAAQVAQGIMQGQFSTDVLETMVAHINEHYSQALQQGVKKEALTEVSQFLAKVGPELAKLKEVDAQAAQVSALHDQMSQQQPPPQEGVPQ
jgi:hypothetical protein